MLSSSDICSRADAVSICGVEAAVHAVSRTWLKHPSEPRQVVSERLDEGAHDS